MDDAEGAQLAELQQEAAQLIQQLAQDQQTFRELFRGWRVRPCLAGSPAAQPVLGLSGAKLCGMILRFCALWQEVAAGAEALYLFQDTLQGSADQAAETDPKLQYKVDEVWRTADLLARQAVELQACLQVDLWLFPTCSRPAGTGVAQLNL